MLAETKNCFLPVLTGFGVEQNLETSGLCKDSSFSWSCKRHWSTSTEQLSTWTSNNTQNTSPDRPLWSNPLLFREHRLMLPGEEASSPESSAGTLRLEAAEPRACWVTLFLSPLPHANISASKAPPGAGQGPQAQAAYITHSHRAKSVHNEFNSHTISSLLKTTG